MTEPRARVVADSMTAKMLGLTGRKYVGKDTAALGLAEYGYTRIAFADPLRGLLYDINPVVAWDNRGREYRWQEVWGTDGYDVLKTLPEARRLMQEVGTHIRERDPMFWVRLAAERIANEPDVKLWAFSDVRFDNEAQFIRMNNGEVIEVIRDTSAFDAHGAAHVSEAGITRSLIDYTVYNNGTVAELHEKVRKIARV